MGCWLHEVATRLTAEELQISSPPHAAPVSSEPGLEEALRGLGGGNLGTGSSTQGLEGSSSQGLQGSGTQGLGSPSSTATVVKARARGFGVSTPRGSPAAQARAAGAGLAGAGSVTEAGRVQGGGSGTGANGAQGAGSGPPVYGLTASMLAVCGWGLARLGLRPPQGWLVLYQRALHRRMARAASSSSSSSRCV